jgi:hypothetical protein
MPASLRLNPTGEKGKFTRGGGGGERMKEKGQRKKERKRREQSYDESCYTS